MLFWGNYRNYTKKGLYFKLLSEFKCSSSLFQVEYYIPHNSPKSQPKLRLNPVVHWYGWYFLLWFHWRVIVHSQFSILLVHFLFLQHVSLIRMKIFVQYFGDFSVLAVACSLFMTSKYSEEFEESGTMCTNVLGCGIGVHFSGKGNPGSM